MWAWISNQTPGRVARWAAVFVLGLWLIWMAAAAAGTTRKWPPDISALGQSGDTFGSINALFTGLALIGLVYTVFLQRVEIDDNRQSLEMNRREQFLSARLNARTALLQAAIAAAEHDRESSRESVIPHRINSSGRVRIETLSLEVLLCEIHGGVSPEPWNLDVERSALADYCLRRATVLARKLKPEPTLDGGVKKPQSYHGILDNFIRDASLLDDRYGLSHPELARLVRSALSEANGKWEDFRVRKQEIEKAHKPDVTYSTGGGTNWDTQSRNRDLENIQDQEYREVYAVIENLINRLQSLGSPNAVAEFAAVLKH